MTGTVSVVVVDGVTVVSGMLWALDQVPHDVNVQSATNINRARKM